MIDDSGRIPIKWVKGSIALAAALAIGEGYVQTASRPLPGDRCTGGFGDASMECGQKTTPVRALVKMIRTEQAYEKGMKQCLDPNASVYQYEWDAYADFTYNLGIGNFCHSSIPPNLNAGKNAEACSVILLYGNFHKHFEAGVYRRRVREYNTCMYGVPLIKD
ncbi:MAG: hypothetical protein KGI54_13800 [Pseudomonadota bacterium]|nr:hypothetical protein [Pseudomonadota bacterium]